jgi:hypothetical protein
MDIYIDKSDELLIKLSVEPIFQDLYTFKPLCDIFDFDEIPLARLRRLGEVRLLEEYELIMYKLIGKIS